LITKLQLRKLIVSGISSEELSKYNYSGISDMSWLLARCTMLKTIPLIDTSNVVNMNRMFDRCTMLKTIPLLDTSNVVNMDRMFCDCESLTTIPLLNTSMVTECTSMFQGCNNISELDYSWFDVYQFGDEHKYIQIKYPEQFI